MSSAPTKWPNYFGIFLLLEHFSESILKRNFEQNPMDDSPSNIMQIYD